MHECPRVIGLDILPCLQHIIPDNIFCPFGWCSDFTFIYLASQLFYNIPSLHTVIATLLPQ